MTYVQGPFVSLYIATTVNMIVREIIIFFQVHLYVNDTAFLGEGAMTKYLFKRGRI